MPCSRTPSACASPGLRARSSDRSWRRRCSASARRGRTSAWSSSRTSVRTLEDVPVHEVFHPSELPLKSIFVESVRLLIVIVLMSAGYALGSRYHVTLFGSVLGASIGYVAGGVLGRYLRRATERVEVHSA